MDVNWLRHMDSNRTSSQFPGFSEFFRLGDPVADRPFRATLDLSDQDEVFRLTTGDLRPPEPVKASHAMGSADPGDVIWTTWAVAALISERLVDLLTTARITGWSTYPVELRGKAGEVIDGYHGFAVTGRCGPIEDSRSGEVVEPPLNERAKARRFLVGYYFEPESWDGSEIFNPKGSGMKFIGRRVRDLFVEEKVRNVKIEAIDSARRFVGAVK